VIPSLVQSLGWESRKKGRIQETRSLYKTERVKINNRIKLFVCRIVGLSPRFKYCKKPSSRHMPLVIIMILLFPFQEKHAITPVRNRCTDRITFSGHRKCISALNCLTVHRFQCAGFTAPRYIYSMVLQRWLDKWRWSARGRSELAINTIPWAVASVRCGICERNQNLDAHDRWHERVAVGGN
jgi:hypothetical protein